jgi:hypothetical protein
MAYATSAEYATFSGSSDITATATATVLAGAINTLTIGSGGGYGYGTSPAVVIAAPTTGVRATATATVANGVVTLLTITGAGSGYGATAPAVTIDPPTDLTRLLLRASELIDDYTRTAIYAVDTDGMPTDTDIIAAFRDATCAQVEAWETADEEDDILGPVDTVGLAGVTAKGRELAPRAARILREAGLYSIDTVTM